jgi:hypothetical protein
VLALLAGAVGLLGAFQAASRGCRLVFSQSDFGPADPNAVPPEGSCEQFVDVLGIALPLVLGLILVTAAWRYVAGDRFSRALVALAIPVGVFVGVVPLYAYWQLHSFYRLAYGPAELAFFALGLAIVVVALLAGWRTVALLGWRSAAA